MQLFSAAYRPGERVIQVAEKGKMLPDGQLGKIRTIERVGEMEIVVQNTITTAAGEVLIQYGGPSTRATISALYFVGHSEPESLQDYRPIGEVREQTMRTLFLAHALLEHIDRPDLAKAS